MSQEKIAQLIEDFENCTLPKEEFTHTNHFIMALWYCLKSPLPQAIQKIRSGIMRFNVSVGGQNTATSGYHETITLFYTLQIVNYLATTGVTTLTDHTIEIFLQQPFIDKDYIFRFYNRGLLMSEEARRAWISPVI
jgi:hypothetical protein